MAARNVCIVCGAADPATVTTSTGLRFYCTACFHGWRPPVPEFGYSSVAMCTMATVSERQRAQVDFVRPFLGPAPRVLEIGCAGGEFAAALRSAFPAARYEAIELSSMGGRARPHLDRLHTEPLRALLGKGMIEGPFDLIVLSHVLEHIEDPRGELRAMLKVLGPSGAIFIEVPNRSGHGNLPLDDNISHLHFFSPASLLRLLADEGLEAQSLATGARLDARYADSLRIMARRFALPKPDHALLGKDPELADGDRLVVWGAGSVAVEVLGNFLDAGRIDFFVDGNPAKHGTTCLGRPVTGPDAIGTAPRTILIGSVDFADEISREIARLYPRVAHRLVRIGDVFDRGLDGKRR